MSKSLGNFLLLKEVLERYPTPVIRLLMLQTHYRSPLDFSDSRLDDTTHAYERLANLVRNLRWARTLAACGLGAPAEALQRSEAAHRRRSREVRSRDGRRLQHRRCARRRLRAREGRERLPRRLPGRPVHRGQGRARSRPRDRGRAARRARHRDRRADQTCCYPIEVVDARARRSPATRRAIPRRRSTALLAARAAARTEKNWALADAVRDGLARLGFTIEDTPQGARVTFGG